MGKLIEGLWDCDYCGTTLIRGSVQRCPNCGKNRGKDITFYLPGTVKNHYVPKARADKINRNPDWLCEHCDSLNSASVDSCVSCGAPRTDENLNYFENKKRKENSTESVETPIYDSSLKSDSSCVESFTSSSNYSSNISSTFSSMISFFGKFWKPTLAVLLIAACIFGIFLLFQPKEYELTVSELSWERCINVERYQTVEESDWYLPSGGRLLYTREEYSHSEQILDHYETKTRSIAKERISGYETYVSGYRDLGNGYFEEITSSRPIYETYYETETYEDPVYRSEPVYRTKYYYEIDKWLYERSVITKGIDKSPYWGETNLSLNERTSGQSETYVVKGIDLETDKIISFYLSFEDWFSINVDQNLKVEITLGYGEILE